MAIHLWPWLQFSSRQVLGHMLHSNSSHCNYGIFQFQNKPESQRWNPWNQSPGFLSGFCQPTHLNLQSFHTCGRSNKPSVLPGRLKSSVSAGRCEHPRSTETMAEPHPLEDWFRRDSSSWMTWRFLVIQAACWGSQRRAVLAGVWAFCSLMWGIWHFTET